MGTDRGVLPGPERVGLPLWTVGFEFGGRALLLFSLLAPGIVVSVDATRPNKPNAMMVELFAGIFTFLGLIPGFLARLLYMYCRGTE